MSGPAPCPTPHLDAFLGNEGPKKALKTALQTSSLPHAVLLAGPDGCGRNTLARALAADVLYPEGGPGAGAVLRGQSPEVLLVEGEGKSGQIKVDRIRAVRSDIFHTGLSAKGRVVLVRDAHNMAAPAANALLKVLEEPPADALFLLTARDAAALPLTITSRCALYPLAPLPPALCEEALQKALAEGDLPGPAAFKGDAKTLPALLAAVYGGRLGLGLAALQSEERLAILGDALSAAAAAAAHDGYALLRLFAAYEGRAEEGRTRREALLSDLSDIFTASLRGLSAPGLPPADPVAAASALPLVAEARLALRGNGGPKITFAALAVQLKNR